MVGLLGRHVHEMMEDGLTGIVRECEMMGLANLNSLAHLPNYPGARDDTL